MLDEHVIALLRRVWVCWEVAATWVDVTDQVNHWQAAPEEDVDDADSDTNYGDMPELVDVA